MLIHLLVKMIQFGHLKLKGSCSDFQKNNRNGRRYRRRQEGTPQVQAEGCPRLQEQGPQAWPEGVSETMTE